MRKYNLVQPLLDAKVDPNGNLPHNPALAEAAEHGKTDIVKMLLEAGASPNGPRKGYFYHVCESFVRKRSGSIVRFG